MGNSIGKGDHVYLVDGSSYIFRAYHALPPLTRKSDGLPVGAVSGFCNMLFKLLEDTRQGDKPTHFAVIFDPKGGSFRNQIYDQYKAHRPPPPEDLIPQFGLIREAVRAFNVPCIEMEGFEADDLIATYAEQAAAKGAKVTIVSSDKDLMQLVGDHVTMLDTMKNKTINEDEVVEKFGVGPDKVVDVQSLAGDSADNVPGVPGIGVKTAALLINEYGDLDTLLERAGEIKQTKRRENLIEFADQARVSRELVTLKRDIEVEVPLDDFTVTEPEANVVMGFLKAMEFNQLTRRMAAEFEADPDDFEATPELSGSLAPAKPKETQDAKPQSSGSRNGNGGAPGAVMDLHALEAKIDPSAYECVTDKSRLEEWVEKIHRAGLVAVDTETTGLDAMAVDLVGICLSVKPGEAAYVPIGHGQSDGLDLAGDQPAQLPMQEVIDCLRPVLEHPGIMKVGQNLKYDLKILSRYGISMAPIEDTMLLSYAQDAGLHGHGMDELSELHIDHKPISFKDIAGTGKKQKTFDQIEIAEATKYAAEDADVTLRLYKILKPRLTEKRVTTVYETLERPLVPVLVEMECAGVKVDRQVLARMSGDFAQRMMALEAEAHEQAGETFNLGSPKQLGEILFEKLGMAGGKKTKTGAWATGADVLETLAAEGHDLPKTILAWRQLSKLKSTYTDALPEFINAETGRVHTSYSLAATTTGRLASSDPNLQNIPIRTEEGRQIRTAFVADKGNVLLSADYSQIELRVLAHMADIDALKDAFHKGLDIHAMTASQMFGVPIEGMDPMVRRKAKAINFGIIYGISAFGLANQLSIPRSEAADYIENYFERFPGIKKYMETTIQSCRENGYVETLFGRRCHYPAINSKNGAQRSFMERAAINAPIQGTAADIIRRAMIRMPGALADAGLSARMLLQVHDELIFELPKEEADATITVVKEVMAGAAEPAFKLAVPLIVDANTGANWDEAH
ncbi:MAG: DNA polymerase I [Alphaproteobacteria bacterium]|nr:MAG: DNA polymerase I [Alphaproteobacteria bacterium]